MATTDSHGERLPVNNLIPFRPAKRYSRMIPQDGGAQIVFFTGVRYQRMSEDVRRPRRKRLATSGGKAKAGRAKAVGRAVAMARAA